MFGKIPGIAAAQFAGLIMWAIVTETGNKIAEEEENSLIVLCYWCGGTGFPSRLRNDVAVLCSRPLSGFPFIISPSRLLLPVSTLSARRFLRIALSLLYV